MSAILALSEYELTVSEQFSEVQLPNSSKMQNCIDINQLQFAYGANKVIDIPNWQVKSGQQIFLYGPSGSGKSTLLNLLAGVLAPTEGTIRLLEQDFSRLKPRQKDSFRARHIGMVFQQFNLIPYLSVFDNIALAAYFGKTPIGQIRSKLKDQLEQLDLAASVMDLRADTLSTGQQQRVAIARALVNQPEIIIADEPTSALDAKAKDGFMSLLIDSVNGANSSLVFVSHDPQLSDHFSTKIDFAELNQVGHKDVI